jgi:surface antigen
VRAIGLNFTLLCRRSLALALFLAALAVFSIGTAAQAASGDSGRISGANHRECPDTRCTARAYIPNGTRVPVWCWRDGGWAQNTNRWFRVRYNGLDAWVNANTMTDQPSVPYCSDFRPNETLFSGQSIWSGNGQYRLIMQADGNLVVRGPSGAIWSSRTSGQNGARAIMQADGHLVVYNGSTPIWKSGTYGNSGAYAVMQSDANFVIYQTGTALFATSWYTQMGLTRSSNVPDSTQCTYLAMQRFRDDTGVYPRVQGDAHNWDDSARANGWRVQQTPAAHSIVVFEATSTNRAGHVAYVDAVQKRSDGMWIYIHERNYDFRGSTRHRWLKHYSGLDYVMARQL